MLPFVLGDDASIPKQYRQYTPLIAACRIENSEYGKVCYLSISETFVPSCTTQRRSGIHTEAHPSHGWGGGGWGSGHHADRPIQGVYMASNVSNSCRVWNTYVPNPGPGGNCEHIKFSLTEPIYMKENELHWITDRTPHEALAVSRNTQRQWFRLVTSDIGLWYSKHSTANPNIQPRCPIVHEDKFTQCLK